MWKSKKKAEEVTRLQNEAKNALNISSSNCYEVIVDEGKHENYMVDPKSIEDPKVQELNRILLQFINEVVLSERIIVKNLTDDLYDGQILALLFGKLSSLDVSAHTTVLTNQQNQITRLTKVLNLIDKAININESKKLWNANKIHIKFAPAILHLLVALIRFYRPNLKLPSPVRIQLFIMSNAGNEAKSFVETIIDESNVNIGTSDTDAFDTLFEQAPDKLAIVKNSLKAFVNKHLIKLDIEVNDLAQQFHDGVNYILLLGILEKYFVPLHLFYLNPRGYEQKCHNVKFALNMITDAGFDVLKIKPEDIVNYDLKSSLRILYVIFSKHRNA